eukprot:NODE_348_length_8996_cov_0.416433.p3 type:complete len:221 gc:universal NODE_348_length_8996_cov_0.416433:1450-2112(+)
MNDAPFLMSFNSKIQSMHLEMTEYLPPHSYHGKEFCISKLLLAQQIDRIKHLAIGYMINYHKFQLDKVKSQLRDKIIQLKTSKIKIATTEDTHMKDVEDDTKLPPIVQILEKPIRFGISWIIINEDNEDPDFESSHLDIKSNIAVLKDELEKLLPITLNGVKFDCLTRIAKDGTHVNISPNTVLYNIRDSRFIEATIICKSSHYKVILTKLGARWTKPTI